MLCFLCVRPYAMCNRHIFSSPQNYFTNEIQLALVHSLKSGVYALRPQGRAAGGEIFYCQAVPGSVDKGLCTLWGKEVVGCLLFLFSAGVRLSLHVVSTHCPSLISHRLCATLFPGMCVPTIVYRSCLPPHIPGKREETLEEDATRRDPLDWNR